MIGLIFLSMMCTRMISSHAFQSISHHRFPLHSKLSRVAVQSTGKVEQKTGCEFRQYFPNLSDSQWSSLVEYGEKLQLWNEKINVISRKDIENLYENHIIPSLSLTLLKPFADGSSVIDVGTGGGLPGIPLAIAYPDVQFTLVDRSVLLRVFTYKMSTYHYELL